MENRTESKRTGNKRGKFFGGALALMLLTGGLGVVVGSKLKNPDAVTIRDIAPGPVWSPIATKKLVATVIARGQVQIADLHFINGVSPSQGQSVSISKLPAPSTSLKEGDIAFLADGSPIFVFQGLLPAYRELQPLDEGTDVEQLNAALKRLGYFKGKVTKKYTDATEAAVEKLFDKNRVAVFGPSKEELESLQASRQKAIEASGAVATAREAYRTGDKPVSEDARIAAKEALAAAQDAQANLSFDIEKLRRESDAAIKAAELAVAKAERDVARADRDATEAQTAADEASAVLQAERELTAAKEKVTETKDGVEAAKAAVEEAKLALSDAQENFPYITAKVDRARAKLELANVGLVRAQTTVQTPDGSFYTSAEIQAAVAAAQEVVADAAAALRQAELDVRSAERDIVAKTKAIDDRVRAVAKAEVSVSDAESGVLVANAALQKAKRAKESKQLDVSVELSKPELARQDLAKLQDALKDAEETATRLDQVIATKRRTTEANLSRAESALRELAKPTDLRNLQEGIKTAVKLQSSAATDLVKAEAKTGIVLPLSAYTFLVSVPSKVLSATVLDGQAVSSNSPVLTVAGGDLLLEAGIERAFGGALHVGDSVPITLPDNGLAGTATISAIGVKAPTVDPSLLAFRANVVLDDIGNTNVESLANAQILVNVPIEKMETDGLTVPLSAVVTKPNRSSVVRLKTGPDTYREVGVKTGLSADGEVEIQPILAGSLKAGDLVQVGVDVPQDSVPETSVPVDSGPADSAPSDSGPQDSVSTQPPGDTEPVP
jgi:peptidoglycan hydrolase-like protein with peptidoglycan-binding domain